MGTTEQGNGAIHKDAPILITGSSGFIGRNLVARLRATGFSSLLLYDMDTPAEMLANYTQQAAFVFHLAGINRPKDNADFYEGNSSFTQQLLSQLKEARNKAPVVMSSTTQVGNGSDYALSKQEAENAVLEHSIKNHSKTYVYRLPGVFGKWSRPNYNTVVATFCHNIARGLPIEVRDPAYTLPLCYIDDVVDSFIRQMDADDTSAPLLDGGPFLGIEPTYEVTLGWLSGTLRSFAKTRETLALPSLSNGITRKLWATYQSFLPEDGCAYPLKAHVDERGAFAEFVRTREHGQFSVNITAPGLTKGNHWHDTKNEKFLVVSGEGLIRIRPINSDVITEYAVSGDKMTVVDIPPGRTHNITNTGTVDLVTFMWASEPFDPDAPDTFHEEV